MTLRRYRFPALLVLVLHLQACASWGASPLPPRQLIDDERPRVVRITRTDGTQSVVSQPRIESDSIVGTSEECRTSVAVGGRGGGLGL